MSNSIQSGHSGTSIEAQPLLVIMAGGTGGHVFPGLAVAEEMCKQGWRVEWFGTADKMEAQVVPQQGYAIHFLDVKGLRGKGIWVKLTFPFMLISSVWRARKILKKLQANAVLGMGGFASGPGALAAWMLGIPIIIHEQNAVFGMTNRYLSKVAKRVLCGFDIKNSAMAAKSPQNVEFVGNPVRGSFFKISKTERSDAFRILVVGGSLGALALNESIPGVINRLRQTYPIQVVHQAGKGKAAPVAKAYSDDAISSQSNNSELNEQNQILEFIDDIPTEFANADIVICRAGALTVAEVAATASCAIFVPLPIAVDDHQTYNARSLSDSKAALLIQQDELEEKLFTKLSKLLANPEQIKDMGRKARALSIQNATVKVCAAIVQEGLRKAS